MDKISLEQLEEMQKDLFKKQCDLDIQKAFVKHFIKKKQSEQLTIPVVVKPFYCLDEVHRGKEDVCQRQCDYCRKRH
jgi:hypothetical protein